MVYCSPCKMAIFYTFFFKSPNSVTITYFLEPFLFLRMELEKMCFSVSPFSLCSFIYVSFILVGILFFCDDQLHFQFLRSKLLQLREDCITAPIYPCSMLLYLT